VERCTNALDVRDSKRRGLTKLIFLVNMPYVPNIKMQRKLRAISVHNFGTCVLRIAAQLRNPIFLRRNTFFFGSNKVFRVEVNPSKKKSTTWEPGFETWGPISGLFFWIWYKIPVRFVFRACLGSIISWTPRGTCESSCRSSRRKPGVKSAPFMVPDLRSPRNCDLARPLRNDPV